MAEICKECYLREHGKAYEDRLVMSKELDLCEWCGQMKPVVVRIRKPGLWSWLMERE